jgi:Zn-dependent protease with chaperone function
MDRQEFETLVTRLERFAAERPGAYTLAVLGVAALGFCVLGVAFSFAFLPAALLIGVALLLATKGAWALLFLANMGKLVLLLAIPAWTMIRSSVSLLFSRFEPPQGRELTASEAPRLFERLDELRRRMNGPAIHKVLLVDALNAAIVQHPRFGLMGWEQNILILGLPLLQSLSEEEALAVVAHEYGHLSGHHARLGGFIYRFRAAWGRLQELSEKWTDWGSRLIARLFRWYAPYFNAYTFVLARQNEYQADRTSVEVAGRQNAANALMRVSIASLFAEETFWPSIDRRVALEAEPPGNRSEFWGQSLHAGLDPEQRARFLDMARQRQTDHLNTHPALKDRLAAIGAPLDDDVARRLEPPALSASSAWLEPGLKQIAAELDGRWREQVAERWRSRHAHLGKLRQRLDELESHEALTIDELWERVVALREVRPGADLMPPLGALLNLAPEHLPGRFRRGTLLLERGDEAGIADLEFVMAKDRDAIVAGCETAWRFYRSRDPDKAKAYLLRRQEQVDLVGRVKQEKAGLLPDAKLVAADLSSEVRAAVLDILRQHGARVRRAYVLRRILKSDASAPQHVLAFETSTFSFGDKGPVIVKRLAAQAFPGAFLIVHLGSNPVLRKTIERLGIEPFWVQPQRTA